MLPRLTSDSGDQEVLLICMSHSTRLYQFSGYSTVFLKNKQIKKRKNKTPFLVTADQRMAWTPIIDTGISCEKKLILSVALDPKRAPDALGHNSSGTCFCPTCRHERSGAEKPILTMYFSPL